MSKLIESPFTVQDYERFAKKYFHSLPMEHFMEAVPQAYQRKITLESLDLLHARRPDVQIFSESLLLYQHKGRLTPVVPDNMVVLDDRPVHAIGSFNVEFEDVKPFWVLEWVSDNTKGKDYVDSFRKYERELRVPYCLMFHPDRDDLRLYRHTRNRYELVTKNDLGRLAIPELELELAMLDGWVRFWYKGEMLPLPADLLEQVEQLEARVKEVAQRADQERRRADEMEQLAKQEQRARLEVEAELARHRAMRSQPSSEKRHSGSGKRKRRRP